MVSKVMAWRDSRAGTPRAADIGVTVLRALLEYGRLRGRVTTNVAVKIPTLYRGGNRAEVIWTDHDLALFESAAASVGKRSVADGLRLAAATGLRREDLVTLMWHQVGEVAITKKALKTSRGKRRFATIPRVPELDALLDELKGRTRKKDVGTVLVDHDGASWTPDRLTKAVSQIRDKAGIAHIDAETGQRRKQHLHDARGTFATRLMTRTDLNDAEIADIMGWSPDEVGRIRRVYVDQNAIVVALGERIRRGGVNRNCKPALFDER